MLVPDRLESSKNKNKESQNLPFFCRFDALDSLIPNSDLLNVTFSIWDMGQDIAASAEVLGIQTWECSLAFTINVPVAIVGQTSAVIAAGTSNGVYEVKFEGSGLNLQFTTTCTSPESGRSDLLYMMIHHKKKFLQQQILSNAMNEIVGV